jgi:diguanylate cyclase (GGDEF)-like protein
VLFSFLLLQVIDAFDGTLAYAFALALAGVASIAGAWVVAFEMRDRFRAQADAIRLATTDRLTGLSNRRAMSITLGTQWKVAMRTRKFLSLVVVDVDCQNRFDDLHGYSVGDETLIMVANCISATAPWPAVRAGRYSATEFLLLLPDTSPQGAIIVGEAIRQAVMDMRLRHDDSMYGLVTVSIGCATCTPGDGLEPSTLVAAAETQMQVAKARGRNRVMSTALNAQPSRWFDMI